MGSTVRRAWRAGVLLVLVGGAAALILVPRPDASGVEVGDRAPEYAAPSLRGDEVALADVRGRVTMVNVWATWCGPCRVEMPSIQALYDRYRDRGFTVLAVSIDQGSNNRAQVEEFVSEYELTIPVLLDPEKRITRVFQTAGVPETFILDRDGVIVKRLIGASDWNSESNRTLIEELLRE